MKQNMEERNRSKRKYQLESFGYHECKSRDADGGDLWKGPLHLNKCIFIQGNSIWAGVRELLLGLDAESAWS